VRTSITPGLCVAGERSSAWSIVWNLATNAVEALPNGGAVLFQLTATGELVHLCISDNGPGMSADVRARVFEPYFTTKRSGTGLGLAVVKQAVTDLGGQLELDTQPGRGTRFQIDLPRALSAEKPRRRSHTSSKRSSGVFLAEHLDGRFLVLDDDPALRDMIATALEMRGAQVVAVSSLADALQTTGKFKLALVDLMLGDQRGDVAIARLRAAGMISTAMIVTGTEPPRRFAPNGEPDALLRKPFELQDLYERVAEVLSRERDSKTAAG
jgi:CheY-like chemotaxis protein